MHFPGGFAINDNDKNGFMATVHGLDRSKGLDLILHTPGGGIAATESIVQYIRSMFGTDVRVIVPQLAMSAGTMIACAAREIVMGKQSSLGPIDPQMNGIPAHGVLEEFERAAKEIKSNPETIPLWQRIIGHYHPTLIGECEKAIQWSEEMVREWLVTGMFAKLDEAERMDKASRVISEFGDHALTRAHDRHISVEKASDAGLNILSLESNQQLQDLVLSVHHSSIQTIAGTTAAKIIENQLGRSFIQTITA